MKKNFIKFLTFTISTTLVLTGCSSTKSVQTAGNENSGKPVELTLWHETEAPIADALKEELKKLEPNIKVNVVRKEKMADALKLASNNGGSGGPDLIWSPHDKIGNLAAIKAIQPIDDIVGDNIKNFLPIAQNAVKFQDKVYEVPVYYETVIMLYNKKLLSTVPKNTDELLTMMKEKTKDGNYGLVEQHSTAYYAAAWINGFGGYLINEKGEPGLNKQETIDALTYHKEFVQYMPKDGEWNTVSTLFNEGKAAATFNGPWIIADAKAKGIDLGFAQLPIISKNGKPLKPFAGVQGLMMSANTKNKEAAAKVIKLLLNKDLGEALALKTGAAPAHKDAYNNTEIANNDLIKAIKETAENAVPMPNIPETDVIWDTSETALAAINKKDGTDIKAALDTAQKNTLTKIQDMK